MNRKVLIAFVVQVICAIAMFTEKEQRVVEAQVRCGTLTQEKDNKEGQKDSSELERFFRPSNLPVVNTRMVDSYVKANQIHTIINYYSILREAAHPLESTRTGCGTIGMAMNPYPIAGTKLKH